MAKTHLQNIAIAAAINLERLVNWLHEVPRAAKRDTNRRSPTVSGRLIDT
ncbi:MAG: hypothetical protein DCF22_13225 [Leptolyngbya sp.]|nr:MAG: hypothetical protein DCF22_13225 [Leptolyngbya sp.]